MNRFLRLILVVMMVAVPASYVFAQGNAAKGAKKKGRERILSREAKVSKDKKRVDFEAVDIDGAPRTPMGTMVNQSAADKNHDLIKLRTNWNPEMIQSAASVDSGR